MLMGSSTVDNRRIYEEDLPDQHNGAIIIIIEEMLQHGGPSNSRFAVLGSPHKRTTSLPSLPFQAAPTRELHYLPGFPKAVAFPWKRPLTVLPPDNLTTYLSLDLLQAFHLTRPFSRPPSSSSSASKLSHPFPGDDHRHKILASDAK